MPITPENKLIIEQLLQKARMGFPDQESIKIFFPDYNSAFVFKDLLLKSDFKGVNKLELKSNQASNNNDEFYIQLPLDIFDSIKEELPRLAQHTYQVIESESSIEFKILDKELERLQKELSELQALESLPNDAFHFPQEFYDELRLFNQELLGAVQVFSKELEGFIKTIKNFKKLKPFFIEKFQKNIASKFAEIDGSSSKLDISKHRANIFLNVKITIISAIIDIFATCKSEFSNEKYFSEFERIVSDKILELLKILLSTINASQHFHRINKIKYYRETIDELAKEKKLLENKLDDLTTYIVNQLVALMERERKFSELSNAKFSLEEENKSKMELLSEKDAELKRFERELNEKIARIQILESQKDFVLEEKKQLEKEINVIERQLASMRVSRQVDNNASRTTTVHFDDDGVGVQEETKLEERVKNIKLGIKICEEKLMDLEEERITIISDKARLQVKLESVTNEKELLREEIEKNKSLIEGLTIKVNNLSENKQANELEISKLNKVIKEYENKLKEELELTKKKLMAHKIEMQQLKIFVETQKETINSLHDLISEDQSKSAVMEENFRLRQEMEQLRRQVEELKSQGNGVNAGQQNQPQSVAQSGLKATEKSTGENSTPVTYSLQHSFMPPPPNTLSKRGAENSNSSNLDFN